MRDYIDLFNQHDAEQEALRKRLPCCVCGEPIDEDCAIHYGEDWYNEEHEECMSDFFDDIKSKFRQMVVLEDAG